VVDHDVVDHDGFGIRSCVKFTNDRFSASFCTAKICCMTTLAGITYQSMLLAELSRVKVPLVEVIMPLHTIVTCVLPNTSCNSANLAIFERSETLAILDRHVVELM